MVSSTTSNDSTTEESARSQLQQFFEAERHSRSLHAEIVRTTLAALAAGNSTSLDVLEQLVVDDGADAVDMVCAARVLGELEGPKVADCLIVLLNHSEPEVRSEAGDQLQDLAFDRFKEVALATERALKALPTDAVALLELPYVLVEIPEGGVVKLLGKFLRHESADVVAAAVEALVEVGDRAAIRLLEPLADDARPATLEGAPEADVTLGELVREALELLEAVG